MKLDIPLDSNVTFTIDPTRKILSITDELKPASAPGYAESRHIWLSADEKGKAAGTNDKRVSARGAYSTITHLAHRTLFRKPGWTGAIASWIAVLGGVCFLGFIYARHSASSAGQALHEASVMQPRPQSLQIPAPPHADIPPPARAASPNAAFGLD